VSTRLENCICTKLMLRKRYFKVSAGHSHSFSTFWPPQSDLDEVEKVIYQGFHGCCEFIFYFLASPKCDLGDVENAMFQGAAGTANTFSASLQTFALSSKRFLTWLSDPRTLLSSCCRAQNATLLSSTGHLDTGFSWFPCVY
jgi:hypothetical protein